MFAFQNPSLPLEKRIDDLVSRLSLAEKCSQLHFESPAVERLGIPAYNWWNEGLHGVGRNGRATVFPQAIGLAAMWDPNLTEIIACAIADEARAKHHAAIRRGSRQQYQGITLWSPNINIFRDPRWGRGQETWGEDPVLTGELGAAFVRGLQGDDPRFLKTAACAKHLAVHSGPEALRHEFDAKPPVKDFRETYLPAFKRLVDEGVEAVMGAYNRIYGEPCCGSRLLITEILRGEWDFKGHYVSDCWAIKDFHASHKVTNCAEESAALALKTGCDLNCGSVYCQAIEDAIRLGLVEEADVDRSLRRLLRTRFRLGMFDPPESIPFAAISTEVVHCSRHRELAFRAAVQSIVLLKNRDDTLPLAGDLRSMLVTGPLAASVDVMLGNYCGISPSIRSVIEGIARYAPEGVRLEYRQGCLLDRPRPNPSDWSAFEAASRDVVVACVGLSPTLEGEEGDALQSPFNGDRQCIELDPHQHQYLRAIADAIREKGLPTRLVVVLFGGGPIAIPEVHDFADAVLQVWYPGEAGGDAIAAILFGHKSPGGRMPVTTPLHTNDLPPFEDYAMKGRTYRYMRQDRILFPFGFGLSYTNFEYSDMRIEEAARRTTVRVRATVTNTGARAGDEVAQLYLSGPEGMPHQPTCHLVRFQRLQLQPGESKEVEWTLHQPDFSVIDNEGHPVSPGGRFDMYLGGAAPFRRSMELNAPKPLHARLDRHPVFSANGAEW